MMKLKNNQKLNFITLSCILIFSSCLGCASSSKSIELTRDYRRNIKKISVSNDIRFTCEDMEILPFKYMIWGCCLAGPVGFSPGLLIDMSRGNKQKKKLKEVVAPDEILKFSLFHEFVSILKGNPQFEYVESDSDITPDAEFVIVVREHGLLSCRFSGKTFSPDFEVEAYLINSPPYEIVLEKGGNLKSMYPEKNPVVFYKRSKVYNCNTNSYPLYEINDFLEDPEKFAEVYSKASRIISKRILRDL